MAGNVSRQDLIRLVERIIAQDGTEEEVAEMVSLLRKHVPDPQVSNYIFWADPPMSPEEIVDKALAYKSIQL